MTESQNDTTAGGRGRVKGARSAGARLAEIWADITNGQRRADEINRPWVAGPGRTNRSR